MHFMMDNSCKTAQNPATRTLEANHIQPNMNRITMNHNCLKDHNTGYNIQYIHDQCTIIFTKCSQHVHTVHCIFNGLMS